MNSNYKSKEFDIKHRICYYFEDIFNTNCLILDNF